MRPGKYIPRRHLDNQTGSGRAMKRFHRLGQRLFGRALDDAVDGQRYGRTIHVLFILAGVQLGSGSIPLNPLLCRGSTQDIIKRFFQAFESLAVDPYESEQLSRHMPLGIHARPFLFEIDSGHVCLSDRGNLPVSQLPGDPHKGTLFTYKFGYPFFRTSHYLVKKGCRFSRVFDVRGIDEHRVRGHTLGKKSALAIENSSPLSLQFPGRPVLSFGPIDQDVTTSDLDMVCTSPDPQKRQGKNNGQGNDFHA